MKTLPLAIAAAVALSAALAVGGCRSGTNTIEVRRGDNGAKTIEVDGKLAKLAKFRDVSQFRQNGMLTPQVEVENLTGRDQNIATQWVWFEGNFQVAQDVRKTQNLEPRQTIMIQGVAPNGNVDGYRLNVSRASGD